MSALRVVPTWAGVISGLKADAAILENDSRFSMAARLKKYAQVLEQLERAEKIIKKARKPEAKRVRSDTDGWRDQS